MNRDVIYKTVTVTNPRNVLVQIPSIIAGVEWSLKEGDQLEVSYNGQAGKVTIQPAVQRRGNAAEESDGVASSTGT